MTTEDISNPIYILGDGDNIGKLLDRYVFSHNFEGSLNLSQNVNRVIQVMKCYAEETMKAQIIAAGGDDLMLCVSEANYNHDQVNKLAQLFETQVDSTFSIGVGRTFNDAAIGLRKSKAAIANKKVHEVGL